MKRSLAFSMCLFCLVYLQSCGGSTEKKSTDAEQKSALSAAKVPEPKGNNNLFVKNKEDLVGYWVGNIKADTLYDNMADYEFTINISVDAVTGDEFKGHTVMLGIVSPITGTIKEDHNTFTLLADQQGSGNLDGAFNASIPIGDTVLSGAWTPKKVIKGVSGRLYTLTKKSFHYDPTAAIDRGEFIGAAKPKKSSGKTDNDSEDEFATTTADVIKYNPSTQLLTKEEVANLKKADLLVLRNSIFARHGYAFKKPILRGFFEEQHWYIPLSANVTGQLTAIEKKNIELINRYEKNAKDYYASFGR